jgi:recombination protein RecA
MATVARADIEALLRARKLDTTLTTARPLERLDDRYVVPTGIDVLDARLGGGLARGQISEIVGPRSSGRTSIVMSALSGATRRGELAALVDTFDTFDPPSAHAGGVDLTRLLWVRGQALAAYPAGVAQAGALRGSPMPPPHRGALQGGTAVDGQAIDRALKALNLILQAGGFSLVVLDLADATPSAVRRLPFTTWFRLQRPIEGGSTACVLVATEPVTRSAAGVSIALSSGHVSSRAPSLFTALDVGADIRRARGVTETCRFALDATTGFRLRHVEARSREPEPTQRKIGLM